MNRPTSIVQITIDAHPEERAAWRELAATEHQLTRDREKLETVKRGPVTKRLNQVRTDMDALAVTIDSGILDVTVQGLSRGTYRALMRDHAPRPSEPLDERLGYNVDTFAAALIREATVSAATKTGDPVTLDVDAWIDDDTGVSNADFDAWFTAALTLQTRQVGSVPRRRAS